MLKVLWQIRACPSYDSFITLNLRTSKLYKVRVKVPICLAEKCKNKNVAGKIQMDVLAGSHLTVCTRITPEVVELCTMKNKCYSDTYVTEISLQNVLRNQPVIHNSEKNYVNCGSS